MSDALTILAVDDEPVNLRLLEAVLAPRGHRILRATSGPECLDVLARHDDVDLRPGRDQCRDRLWPEQRWSRYPPV